VVAFTACQTARTLSPNLLSPKFCGRVDIGRFGRPHIARTRRGGRRAELPRVDRLGTVLAARKSGQQTPYLAITGTARIVEGGAPELLQKLAKVMPTFCPQLPTKMSHPV
jgi:hypothetical protein